MASVLDTVLKNRGYRTASQREVFLSPEYERHVHDPFGLEGMEAAVDRVARAVSDGERIVVYGDYDIDGLSATALLLDALGAMDARVEAYIPDRFEEGYGISTEALKKLQGRGADLVITVDCGSVSHEPLAWAAEHGLDVIVTDHHEVGDTMPPAVAIINPKRPGQAYPFGDLAGVGVAFKLVQALSIRHQLLPSGREKWLLDLVALGTVCDVVDLVDENRVLVTYGLQVFRRTPRVGLRALALVAGIEPKDVEAHHFGFVLGPRLNAAGRLEHAKYALEVFVCRDKSRALQAARALDEMNSERRSQQDVIMEMALEQAEQYREDPVLVLSHPEWNHGIVGIVAAKIMEKHHKPTIILQELGETTKGSARSLGGFSMVEALRAATHLLHKHGGHHVAAGCTLATRDIAGLRAALNEHYRQQGLGDLYSLPTADMEIASMDELNEATYDSMQRLAPFGKGNPRPMFYMEAARVSGIRRVGADGRHLKAVLSDGSHTLDAIGFQLGDRQVGSQASVWFELEKNTFGGREQLQCLIKDIR